MKLLIKGVSAHTRDKILPALDDGPFELVGFVSRGQGSVELAKEHHVICVPDLASTDELNWDILYVASPIGAHFEDVKTALSSGKHVICEKILCRTSEEANYLFDLAESLNLFLFEVRMYQYHPQYIALKSWLETTEVCAGNAKAELSFTIPHLEADNFRYDARRGGGAIYDIGYYPLSATLDLFGAVDLKKAKIVRSRDDSVDLAGQCTLFASRFGEVSCT